MQYALTLIALAILVLGAYYLIPNYFRLYLHRSLGELRNGRRYLHLSVGEDFIMGKVLPIYLRSSDSPRRFKAYLEC